MTNLLIISLVINFLCLLGVISFIHRKGGISYLRKRILEIFKENNIVFLGDSLTQGSEWEKLLQNTSIINRGIGGDTTDGILGRISNITKAKPKDIFLMIGINDLLQGKNEAYVYNNYQRILNKISMESPDTRIIVQSILPTNNIQQNTVVMQLNNKIQSLCNNLNIYFVNLYPLFANKDNELNLKYALEGLHLNTDGYLVWKNSIKHLI